MFENRSIRAFLRPSKWFRIQVPYYLSFSNAENALKLVESRPNEHFLSFRLYKRFLTKTCTENMILLSFLALPASNLNSESVSFRPTQNSPANEFWNTWCDLFCGAATKTSKLILFAREVRETPRRRVFLWDIERKPRENKNIERVLGEIGTSTAWTFNFKPFSHY